MSMPDIHFADLDTRRVEASVVTGFEAAARKAGQGDFILHDGDPRRLFLSAVALMLAQQNAMIDLAGKGNLLRYAGDDTIEDLGWIYGKRGDRLQPMAAVTTIEFTLSAPMSSVATIPAGIHIVAGSLTFATMGPLEIPAGSLTGEVKAECVEAGPQGNGMLPGQVFQIVNRPPFVEGAVNITESSGGAGLEELEAYRERVRNAPESFSVAGPSGAYWFWAKTADPGIADVAVWMPDLDVQSFGAFLAGWGITDVEGFMGALNNYYRESGTGPGNVDVAVLMEGGQPPTQDIIDRVGDVLDGRNIRPLTDFVHVLAAEAVGYSLKMTYWIDRGRAEESVAIQGMVNKAIQAYIAWQGEVMGRAVIPDELTQRVKEAGARRLEIAAPGYTLIGRGQVAKISGEPDIIYGGLE